MKNNRTALIEELELLVQELEKTNNSTTDFYRTLGAKLGQVSNEQELKEILEGILRSGAIVQYADYSHKQETTWNRMYEEAVKLAKKN